MSEIHFNYVNSKIAGYRFDLANIGQEVYDPLQYWIKENFNDVKITRDNIPTDLTLLNRKAIITVNGYVHPTVIDNGMVYIEKAAKTMLKSRLNHIGILSFNKLSSDIVKRDITESMITPDGIFPLYEKCIITFSEDIKTPILIIGGYMQFEEENVFYRISDNSFALSLSRLQYMERLYETSRYRDIFTELEIPVSLNNPSMIDGDIARSDLTIFKYLTLFNSYLLELDIDNITLNKIYFNDTKLPGTMYLDYKPIFPVFSSLGKILEYQATKGPENRYIINTLDNYYNNFLFSRRNIDNLTIYTNNRTVGNTYYLSKAYMLDISTNI